MNDVDKARKPLERKQLGGERELRGMLTGGGRHLSHSRRPAVPRRCQQQLAKRAPCQPRVAALPMNGAFVKGGSEDT
ncbi:unnamed protein product [Pleuronectes platessa]|uniref:Uncharacterized protein n=1 Tax=Pleuronectes platessa TaxID=8262 RepID=A0A9N7VJN7_PLEPL|nr:unnamed protein product [Pleuronectes platessa]